MGEKIKKLNALVFLMLFFAIVFSCIVFTSNISQAYSSTYPAPASIGSLTLKDYDKRTDGKVFDGEILDKLYALIIGEETADYEDLLNKVNSSTSSITGSADDSSKSVDEQPKSMNFKQINKGNAITVKFGQYTWNVVYVTANTTTANSGDVIATLWMSDIVTGLTDAERVWSSTNSVYSNSNVSNILRNHTKFSEYNTALKDFIAYPNQVKYQEKENAVWSYLGTGSTNLCPNEAWGEVDDELKYNGGGGWLDVISSITNDPNINLWAERDRLWLPSMVEMGYHNSTSDYAASLWNIPYNDSISKSSGRIWTRSGGNSGVTSIRTLTDAGVRGYDSISKSWNYRPALHLNLTKANEAAAKEYNNPQDITTPIYNDNAQTPVGLTTKPSWWNSDFADTSKFTFEYFDSQNKLVTAMKNAGEYWVKLSVNSSYAQGVFGGTANTDDEDHKEDNKTRWFKFKINPKPIEVKMTKQADGTYMPEAKNESDIALSDADRKPVFGVDYTSSDGKGYTFNHPNKPDKVGEYIATAIITNAETCNFTIDKTKSYTATYIHNKQEVAKPNVVLPSTPDVYKKADYEYSVSGYDDSKMTLKLPSGASYDAVSKKIKVSNAGTYEISFELNSPSENCWAGDKSINPVKFTITIKKKPISVPGFNATLVNSSEIKNATIAKVPASEIVDVEVGDTYPDILIMFDYQDSTGSGFNSYPTTPGKYKATLKIDNPETCNYELDSATAALVVNFDVTGAVAFKQSDIVWIATPNAGGNPITMSSPFELPFIIGGYTISISNITADKMSLKSKGVKIYTDGANDNGYSGDIQQTDVGTYTAKVRLINYDNSFDSYDETFSLSWKINPHQVTKPTYSGDDITFSKDPTDLATLFGLPSDWATYVDFEIEKNGESFSGTTVSDVGTYNVTVKIKPSMAGNVTWGDSTRFPVQQIVKINPRTVEITGWSSTAGIPKPQTTEPSDVDYLDYVYTKADGTVVTESEVNNSLNTTFNVKAVSKYGDNVIVSTVVDVFDNETFSTPGNPNTPPTTVAKPTLVENTKEFTGAELTFELIGFDSARMIMDGSLSATNVGQYTVTIRFRDGINYCWDDNTRTPITLTFSVVEASEPTPPPIKDGENNILKKIKELIDSGFPLWQICTMAVAGLLAVILLIKSIQYGNRRKKLVAKSKKNAVKVAGLMPIFSTEVVLAGLSNQIWSIMAFAFVGLALLMFIVALVTRSAWKKAEATQEDGETSQLAQIMQALQSGNSLMPVAQTVDNSSIIEEMRRQMEAQRREDEARRREDEERHRQEMDALREEQAKRDEAMKLMLANMMGRQQGADNGDMPYYGSIDDTDLLVQKVIAGLLPAVQQMMPDNTAYLTAPGYEESEELKNLVEVQNEQMRSMSEKIDELQNQLAAQGMPASQGNVNLDDLAQKVSEKITTTTNNTTIVQDVSDEKMQAMAEQMALMQQKIDNMAYLSADEYDDDDFDDEEEWDSILDEEDDDFVEAVIIEEDGTVKKTSPNFRMRLKQSSDKNREWYTVIKNMFCSQKGVTYRVCKRVEKIRYQGQVVGVIGIAKRSIKLWLALKPYEYDARRYHHKDVSDKPRFVDVPMYVRVGSDRALTRAQELILALFQELNMEARKRYNDRDIQELIFTLKHNKLLTNKQNKQLLCEVMHVHDCDVLNDETAEKCIETKNVAELDDSLLATVKLDDIDANFQDGNRVTLEKLKKVGLVGEECTGYTVTADKRLTKPLIIVANDFTLTAVKLITLTGGRAIRLTII